jgi:hypothetical protein
LAGGLRRELKSRYGVKPKVRHQYHELEVIVNGQSVFSYLREKKIPTVEGLLKMVETAAAAELGKPA